MLNLHKKTEAADYLLFTFEFSPPDTLPSEDSKTSGCISSTDVLLLLPLLLLLLLLLLFFRLSRAFASTLCAVIKLKYKISIINVAILIIDEQKKTGKKEEKGEEIK